MDSTTQVLIPAAGFGKRAGAPLAKEMLLKEDQILIDWTLNRARQLGCHSHVITRREKTNLIGHLESFSHTTIQLIEPSREWPDTLLKSKPFWKEHNIVLLPDTRFHPSDECLQKLESSLKTRCDVAFLTFHAEDLKTWGVVDPISKKHCEKPTEWPSTALPWGVFGFRYSAGEELLDSLLQSTLDHQWRSLWKFNFDLFELSEFKDLTR